ncbi:tail fiber domain-containing protein [Dyadobacter sp. OTU695]|uniref:tail fiber domain-containing protein n=1 Tax=Dyadobacter sp. OTU695 TaxID=3043860 RepID=UPI00313AE87D
MKNLCTHASGHIRPATAPVTSNSENRKVFSRKPNRILVTLLSVSLLLLSQFSTAQAPQQFSFQGVARGADGKIVANTQISVRIKIHKDGPNGPIVFSETQIVDTNPSGIFNLIIGGLSGGLDDVNWASDNCFIQTEIDIAGGANFVNLGTTQIKSVPYSLVSRQWVNNVPIIQTGVFGSGPTLPIPTIGANLIWYPRKAAFRVGNLEVPGFWESTEIGNNSFAAGKNSAAKGENAVALGNTSNASNLGSAAIGTAVVAGGDYSFAAGKASHAEGESSTVLGLDVYAKSFGSVSLGTFNNISDIEGAPLATDRIFQLGNGSSDAVRSNAITVLRNGNFGIGNNVLSPQYLLDLGGRMRIRHNGQTAGIHFNNSANNEDGFVGMKTDDEIGLYINNGWRFWVTSSNAYVNGNIVNTSDRRLKKQITPVSRSLSSLHSLQGYNYYWNDIKQGRDLQTGLIAQEVEKRFPELVTTNKDGYKAVNYIGLIPHLIEAVKELDKRTEEVAALKKELAEVKEINHRVMALEAGLKSLLTENKSATGKLQAK